MKKKQKKLFIVLDGPDGAGKSTHAKLLYKNLLKLGYDVVLTREPGGTKLAEMIRKILLHSEINIDPLAELLLYESARVQHIKEIIKPALKNNKIVISDRFADASVIYQGFAKGLGIDFVKKLNKMITGEIVADITFILDIEPEEALLRAKYRTKKLDRFEKEDLYFRNKIRKGYLELVKKNKNFYLINTKFKTKKQVQNEIINILKEKFNLI